MGKTSSPLSLITFSWSSERDEGVYDAVNRAIARVKPPQTAFMGWLNADDILWPGALQAVSQFGQEHPDQDWLTGCHSLRNADGSVQRMTCNVFFPRVVLAAGLADGEHWPFMQQESTFWRTRLYKNAGGLNTSLKLAGDWDLWRRFAEHAELVHLRRQLGAFTIRPGQLSADIGAYRLEVERIRQSAALPRVRHGGCLSRRGMFRIQEASRLEKQWVIRPRMIATKKPRGWYILRRLQAALHGMATKEAFAGEASTV